MIKALLFDLDGTLIDSNELIFRTFEWLFREHLHRPITRDEIVTTFGIPLDEVLEHYAPGRGAELLKLYRSHETDDSLLKPCPHVLDGLATLSTYPIRMAVVTSKVRDNSMHNLKQFHIDHYFDAIVTPDLTDKHKPNPEPALKALELLRVAPEEAIMIGDSPYDILCAHNAHIKAAAVSYSAYGIDRLLPAHPDYILHTISDLTQYLT